jgi:hypothetical protein
MMTKGKSSRHAWRDFYTRLFREIPALEEFEYRQGDVGVRRGERRDMSTLTHSS